MNGISFVGHNTYGVFLVKGKLLNVQKISHKEIMENAEINNINHIFGL
jgi:DNA topoisomerase-2